jgi:hypothetical protein
MTDVVQENEYVKEIRDLGIRAYSGTPEEDTYILSWWSELVAAEELDTIFATTCRALGAFYKLFQRPNWLFYMADDQGFTLAIWAEPAFSSAFVGVWVAPRARKSKSVFRAMQLTYYTLFTLFNTLLGVTKQENLLTEHVKLGYIIIGKVDQLLDDQTAWVLQLTKAAFTAGKLNPKRSTDHGRRKRVRQGVEGA